MDYFTIYRQEGAEKEKRKIAKKMKGYGIFTDSFIAEVVGLDIKTVAKLKATCMTKEE